MQFSLPGVAEDLVRDNSSRTFYLVSTIIALVVVATIGVAWSNLPQQVPFFFTYPWGEARLAPRAYLFILPLLSLSFVIVNIIVGKYYHKYPVILSRVLSITSLTTTLMFSIASF